MSRAEENKTRKVKKKTILRKKYGRQIYENSCTKLTKKLLLESVRNSAIYNVSSRIYYEYFTFKDLGYARNIASLFVDFLANFHPS